MKNIILFLLMPFLGISQQDSIKTCVIENIYKNCYTLHLDTQVNDDIIKNLKVIKGVTQALPESRYSTFLILGKAFKKEDVFIEIEKTMCCKTFKTYK